jgi:hypothetical protein
VAMKGTCLLSDISILGNRNVFKKEARIILKYKNLELQHMWNITTKAKQY